MKSRQEDAYPNKSKKSHTGEDLADGKVPSLAAAND